MGLAVGVAVGLAPYLGTQQVPLFTPLLDMVPASIRDSTLPLAAALMGTIAASVQWFGSDRTSLRTLRWAFLATLGCCLLTLSLFMWVNSSYVIKVSAEGGTRTTSFVIGLTRQPSCTCPAGASDEQCIDGLSWDQSAIAQCWGDRAIRQASLLVRGTYLLATGAFGALVGLLVLRGSVRGRETK